MYKLLLVDDSEFVLDGFREKINLGDLGIELAGVATNGEDALELFGSIDPDILVTDIKMPKMDGMELIEAVRKIGKAVKVVILSGYSDFEYARKAISLNAVEYLLKPILKNDIESTLRKIVESLKSEETEVLRKIRLEVQSRQNQEIVKAHLIGSLLEGRTENHQQVREILAPIDGVLLESKVAVVLLEPIFGFAAGIASGDKREITSGMLSTALTVAGQDCIGVILNENKAALVIPYGKAMNDAAVGDSLIKTLKAIMEAIKRNQGLSVSLSAGQASAGIFDIRKSYLQASEAMQHRIIFDRNNVMLFSEIPKLGDVNSGRFAASAKKAMDAIEKGDKEEMLAAVDGFYDGIAAHKDCKPANVISVSYKLALSLGELLRDRAESKNESALWEQLNALASLEELRAWMRGIIDSIFQALESRNRYSRIVSMVVSSIEKNFSRELLLKDMARELYISENYLTTLFKKETGTSFKKYMTGVRIHRAMELLQDPQYKVYEIAPLIGYESEEHFCRMFKESTGVTPKEYRNGGMQPKPSSAVR